MTDSIRAALEQAANELDIAENALLCSSFHNAASRAKQAAMTARAALSQPEPAGQIPHDYIDPQHTGADRELLQAFYAACQSEGGTVDEVTLRGIRAAIAADRAQRQPVPPEPGEVQELVGLIRQIALAWEPDARLLGNMTAGQLARAAELLSQRHPQPVPVSERLPGPEDCIPHPRTKLGNCCWGFGRLSTPPAGLPAAPLVGPRQWTLMYVETIELECSHWLPAHALPLPLPGEVEHG